MKPALSDHRGGRTAKLVSKQIEALKGRKTQRQIAREAGYNTPNIISMIKSGETGVPFERIPALAAALELDPALLFRIVVEEYWPERYAAVNAIFGMVLTANEREFMRTVRDMSGGREVVFDKTLAEELTEVLSKAKGGSGVRETNRDVSASVSGE